MAETSYSEILRELSRKYYNRSIGIDDYRLDRREVLNAIDHQYNGVEIKGFEDEEQHLRESPETDSMSTVFYGPTDTQPNFRK